MAKYCNLIFMVWHHKACGVLLLKLSWQIVKVVWSQWAIFPWL